jgi:DNA-binding beta-propeller fold protein YncE
LGEENVELRATGGLGFRLPARRVWIVLLAVAVSLIADGILADSALAVGPTISTSFGVSSIALNGSTSLSYVISAPLGSSQASVGFTDNLPRGVVVSTPNGLDNECGGTVTATDASSTVSLSGASLSSGTFCVISLDVTATWAGTKHNSVTAGSSGGTGNTATADLTVQAPPLRDRVYWTAFTANKISYANLDGSGGGDLDTTGATVSAPAGIAIDLSQNRIYWANSGTDSISYANLDGSGGADLYTSASAQLNDPFGVAIDPGASRIYWPNEGSTGLHANSIGYAYLDGSGGSSTLTMTGISTISSPSGVALDPDTEEIYWSNAASGDNIQKDSLATDNPDHGVSQSPGIPFGVAVDTAAGRAYWAAQGTDRLYYAQFPFVAANQLGFGGASGLPIPRGVAIDPAGGRIYWGNNVANAISWGDLTGGGSGDISSPGQQNAYPTLLKAPLGNGLPVITGPSTPGSTLTCAARRGPQEVQEEAHRARPQEVQAEGATTADLALSRPRPCRRLRPSLHHRARHPRALRPRGLRRSRCP